MFESMPRKEKKEYLCLKLCIKTIFGCISNHRKGPQAPSIHYKGIAASHLSHSGVERSVRVGCNACLAIFQQFQGVKFLEAEYSLLKDVTKGATARSFAITHTSPPYHAQHPPAWQMSACHNSANTRVFVMCVNITE